MTKSKMPQICVIFVLKILVTVSLPVPFAIAVETLSFGFLDGAFCLLGSLILSFLPFPLVLVLSFNLTRTSCNYNICFSSPSLVGGFEVLQVIHEFNEIGLFLVHNKVVHELMKSGDRLSKMMQTWVASSILAPLSSASWR
ncbi:hypothetical protein L484_021767 [Morus notabilis]|uniref:Uncharacterized protein n=1 Tax=Morus notabilis TaxID=981085 RepID=W9SKS1_9ROSA|nr:hypothetical protein L484_021767 [Morus notabilis]